MRKWLIWAGLMLVGALILSPAVALLGLDPLPGDFKFTIGQTHIYLPLATSLIASVSLTLLFFFLRR
jgi:hypothetical protein